jgi:hypothetical protein
LFAESVSISPLPTSRPGFQRCANKVSIERLGVKRASFELDVANSCFVSTRRSNLKRAIFALHKPGLRLFAWHGA